MSFKIGDRVRVIAGPRAGEVTTVTSALFPARWTDTAMSCDPTAVQGELVHRLALQSLVRPWTFCDCPPHKLRRLDDDGREKAEWTEELRRLCGVKETADV